MTDQDPDVRWAELAAALRQLRIASGLSGPALAQRNGWSQSKVSKIENKVTRPSVEDVTAWARTTGAPAERVQELAQVTTEVLTFHRSWRRSLSAGLAARQRGVAAVEAAATSVRVFQTHAIPGLLQVPEYAEQIFRMLDDAEVGGVAEAVAARMNRQSALYRADKSFTFLLGEGALRWVPAFEDVRQAQADRILAMQGRPNITIAVLPFSVKWPVLSALSFTIFNVPDDPTILVEDSDGERLLTGDVHVSRYENRFSKAMSAAVTGAAARKIIAQTAR